MGRGPYIPRAALQSGSRHMHQGNTTCGARAHSWPAVPRLLAGACTRMPAHAGVAAPARPRAGRPAVHVRRQVGVGLVRPSAHAAHLPRPHRQDILCQAQRQAAMVLRAKDAGAHGACPAGGRRPLHSFGGVDAARLACGTGCGARPGTYHAAPPTSTSPSQHLNPHQPTRTHRNPSTLPAAAPPPPTPTCHALTPDPFPACPASRSLSHSPPPLTGPPLPLPFLPPPWLPLQPHEAYVFKVYDSLDDGSVAR